MSSPQRPKTVYEERIYEASPGELIAVLNETPDDLRNVLVIGHNPGMEGTRRDPGRLDRGQAASGWAAGASRPLPSPS